MSFSLAGCGPTTFRVGGLSGNQKLAVTVVEPAGRWLGPRVAIIDVSGTLHNANKKSLLGQSENPVSLLHEKLQRARQDRRVKAIILRLNTPGGTVTASDIMYRLIQRFKHKTEKPVVALIMDVAASGGYYLACSADKVVAYPTSITGSIGVILQTISFKSALGRIGIHAEAFTSGPNKDAGAPLSTLTDEHRKILASLVDHFYQQFRQVVRQARPGIPPERFDQITDGRVFGGQTAVELGLVDQTGDLYDAFALAKKLANIQHADLVIYHRPLNYVGSAFASMPLATHRATTQINLAQFNFPDALADSPATFYYLWQVGSP